MGGMLTSGCCGIDEPHTHLCYAGVDVAGALAAWLYTGARALWRRRQVSR